MLVEEKYEWVIFFALRGQVRAQQEIQRKSNMNPIRPQLHVLKLPTALKSNNTFQKYVIEIFVYFQDS